MIKPIDIGIERRCPICGGKIKKGLKFIAEGAKKYGGYPDYLIYWYAYLDGRTWKRIEELDDFDIRISDFSCHIRICERCKNIWDAFNETDFVLQSNDNTLIHNYMSIVEKSANENPARTINSPLSINLSEKEKRERELHWRLNLVKAKLYKYKYKNHSDIQSEENYNYYQLFEDALQNAEKYHTDNENLLSYEYELRADMSDDILERFNLLNAALTSDISTHRKVRIQNNINELYSTVLDRWKQPISIEKRRIIFIANNLDDIAGYYDPTHSINHFFTIDRIPASIKFPYGQPTGNELYIANPVKPDEYVPYDNFEFTLFKDKILELKRLLRSLGATEITFTCKKGISIDEAERMESSVNAESGLLGHKVSGGYSSEEGQNRMSSQGIKVDYIERLDSYEYPSLPDRLHWYNSDPEWKDIVEARLHHNQLHFEQSISTKQVSSLNEQSQEDINAAYKGLISHINVNYHHEREFHVKTTEETMWRITAEFKPLSEFENSDNTMSHLSIGTQKNLSSDEKEYLEAVEEYLEDGSISERDRRMLERLRKSLGISEERAVALEATLVPQLTYDEKDYLEAVKECLEGGGINDRDRRTLERLRKSLDITEERASELEAMA